MNKKKVDEILTDFIEIAYEWKFLNKHRKKISLSETEMREALIAISEAFSMNIAELFTEKQLEKKLKEID